MVFRTKKKSKNIKNNKTSKKEEMELDSSVVMNSENDDSDHIVEQDNIIVVSFCVSNFGYAMVLMNHEDLDELITKYDDLMIVDIEDDQCNTVEIDLAECVHSHHILEHPSLETIDWIRMHETPEVFERICFEPEQKIYEFQIGMNVRISPLVVQRDGVYKEVGRPMKLGTSLFHFIINDDEFIVTGFAHDQDLTVTVNHNGTERVLGKHWIDNLEKMIKGLPCEVVQESIVGSSLKDELSDVNLDHFDDEL